MQQAFEELMGQKKLVLINKESEQGLGLGLGSKLIKRQECLLVWVFGSGFLNSSDKGVSSVSRCKEGTFHMWDLSPALRGADRQRSQNVLLALEDS